MSNNARVIFVVNKTKPAASQIAERLANLARANSMDADICSDFPVSDSAFEDKDVCCVIGGDGTILSAVEPLVRRGTKVFGVNMGKLGFLATCTDAIDDASFLSLLRGEEEVFERSVLETDFGGKTHYALNEFVVKDTRTVGISSLAVYADGEFIAEYTGDGLIFATPTGSTAYNLSAGGPLLHLGSRSFVMTPICPHTLSNRSLVCNETTKIRVLCVSGESALIADGREISKLSRGEEVSLNVSASAIKFMRVKGISHFAVLRSKLGWAEDPRQNIQ